MQNTENSSNRRIPLREQFIYAFVEAGANPIYTIALSFLTFFYTDVLGVNAGIVGIIILISRIFDGISDIWAGNIIDHTHTKNGSARPWVLRSALPMAVSYVILFTVPNTGEVGKLVYIFVSYNFSMTFAFTFSQCAVNSLPIFMSNDTKSRSSAYAIRLIFAGLVQAILSFLFLNVVDALGGSQAAWIIIAAVLGTISFGSSLVTYFGTKECVSASKGEGENVPILTAIKALLHNKYWCMVFAIILITVLHQVTTLTVGVYYAKYILFDETLAGNLILYHHGGGAVGMLVMPFLLQKGISKRNAALFSGIIMTMGSLIAAFLSGGPVLIVSLALRGCGFGILSSTYFGMLADTVDYGEWKTGVRTQAVTASVGGISQKLGSGLGTAAFGLALSFNGYNGLAASQPDEAIAAIRIIFNVIPLFLYILVIILMIFYKLDKEYSYIQKELQERRNV
jgi:GPH family glycoside/pentoside/hexuronide:cation symporter